ncbi:hypothetical protein ACOMHN_013226 [Nucella lapillus]
MAATQQAAARKEPAPSAWTSDDMQKCLAAIEGGMGVNAASRQFGVPKPTIRRHRLGLNKYATGDKKLRSGPCVLPKDVEDELVRHIKELDELFFGMTITSLRKLAYQVACAHGINKFSQDKQAANKTWYYNFMRRHPELSLRSPEPTSIGRMKGFNRKDVGEFFDKYYKLIEEHGFTADKIYNMDETGHSTVQTPSKVISTKGKRQVGAATSAERGTNTTGVYCDSATGHFIPPMLIFKRKRLADSLTIGAPNGTVFACTDSGWIDSDVFLQWLHHFIRCVKSSPENKHLLLLDGHTSHSKNLEAIKLARENGVIMMSFPAHTTHRLQPLDVTFFKSLKNWYNIEIENYLRSSQAKAVGVHLVSSLVCKSFVKAATMETAVNGFRKTGLWPPNRHIFDEEFSRMEAVLNTACPDSDRLTNSAETVLGTQGGARPARPVRCESATSESTGLSAGQGPETVRSTSPTSAPISCDVPTTTPTGPGPTQSPSTCPASPASNRSNESTPCKPPVCSPATRSDDSSAATCSSGLCRSTVPTKGDGRCFFRAVVIALNPDLQASERNPVTGEILDELKAIQETAGADNIRSMVISHMCQNLHMEPCAAELSADMPERIRFHTVAERILHMSDPQSMVGELEIQSTAAVLNRSVHVIVDGNDRVFKYNDSAQCAKGPLIVKFTPHGEAGHYQGMMPARISAISPLPKLTVTKRKNLASSKSHVLTSSPYKLDLEQKKKKNNKSSDRTGKAKSQPQKRCKPTTSYRGEKAKKSQRKDSSSSEDSDPFCIVCCERYSASKSREKWIACVVCDQWAHEKCTSSDGFTYICHHCDDSDE